MKIFEITFKVALIFCLWRIADMMPDTSGIKSEVAIVSTAIHSLQSDIAEIGKDIHGIDSSLGMMEESQISRNEKLREISLSLDRISLRTR